MVAFARTYGYLVYLISERAKEKLVPRRRTGGGRGSGKHERPLSWKTVAGHNLKLAGPFTYPETLRKYFVIYEWITGGYPVP